MKKQRSIIIAIVVILLIAGFLYAGLKNNIFADINSPAINIYVATNGSDTNSGSISTPFKTIERAKNEIRNLKANNQLSGPANVQIKAGTYELNQTLAFTNEDSGTVDRPITYEGYGGKVTVSGGQKLAASWTKCSSSDPKCQGLSPDAINNVYYSSVGDKKFNSLFINDSRATRARTPNNGQDTGIRDSKGNIISAGFYNIAGCFQSSNDAFKDHFLSRAGDVNPNWKNLTDIEVVGFSSWRAQRNKISSVVATDSALGSTQAIYTVNLTGEDLRGINIDHCQSNASSPGSRYYLDNVFEGLDTPGEWYLEKTAGDLYYMPGTGQAIGELNFLAPSIKQLISIDGESAPDANEYLKLSNPVQYLTFSNLEFSVTDWELPNNPSDKLLQGYNEIQAAAPVSISDQTKYVVNRPSDPSILVRESNNIKFNNNTFSNLGGHALQIYQSDHISVINNQFKNLALGAIVFGETVRDEQGVLKQVIVTQKDNAGNNVQVKVDKFVYTNNIEILSNSIHDFGQVIHSGVGVLGLLARDSRISQNEIYNGNYDAIQSGWDWGSVDRNANNITIEKNVIHDTNRYFSDGGAIYSVGCHLNSKISNNLIYNSNVTPAHIYAGWLPAIYLDNNSRGLTVENNIALNNNSSLNINATAGGIDIKNNIFSSSRDIRQVVFNHPSDSVNFNHNIIFSQAKTAFFSLGYQYPTDTPDYPYSNILTNIVFSKNNYFSSLGQLNVVDDGYYDVGKEKVTGRLLTWENFKTIFNRDFDSINADPQFSSPSSFEPSNTSDYLKRDYSVKSTSPALGLGFKQINTTDIGPKGVVGPDYTGPSPTPTPSSIPTTYYTFPKGFSTLGVTKSLSTSLITTVDGLYVYKFDGANNKWLVAPRDNFTLEPGQSYYVYNTNDPKIISLPFDPAATSSHTLTNGWNLLHTTSDKTLANLNLTYNNTTQSAQTMITNNQIYQNIFIISDTTSTQACSYFKLLGSTDTQANCSSNQLGTSSKVPASKAFWVYVK